MTGKDHWTAGFQHFWLKGRERKLATDYGDYCLELRASLESKFAHLPRNGMNYAFHLDAGLYAKFLRKFAEGFGVKRIEGKIVEVNCEETSGFIESMKLDSGETARRRPVHRLHGLSRPAHRQRAARGL